MTKTWFKPSVTSVIPGHEAGLGKKNIREEKKQKKGEAEEFVHFYCKRGSVAIFLFLHHRKKQTPLSLQTMYICWLGLKKINQPVRSV